MSDERRFVEAFGEGVLTSAKIIVDTQTGVNYLWIQNGHAGGLTPLLDSDGKIIVTKNK